ncbi:MAG: formylglycine-generating enzyme family protein [Spirochaetaceae bacterium]|nr:formylglycine-generating enzyme family protein [Spirochaetaceae bacterium]
MWAAVSTWLPGSAVAELTPAIQADLYLVQTEEYLKEKNYAGARQALENLIKLAEEHKFTVPDTFHFKHAQVLNWAGDYDESRAALHRYLESAGQSGEHYREALTLLHEVSEAEEQAQAAAAEKAAAERAEAAEKAAAERAAAERAAAERAAAERAAWAAQEVASKMKMILVSAGSYQMGSPSGGGFADEMPLHRVTIAKPFAVSAYEVTFAEWDACVAAGGCGGYRPDDEGWGRGRRPVINVSWEDTQRFVAWLSEGTGHTYRLLSEAEWEYVARAGTSTRSYWGESSGRQCRYENGADQTAKKHQSYGTVAGCEDGYFRTAPVGSFEANAYRLHDTLGNVREWVQDCWNDRYHGAPSNGSAWQRGDCGNRVVRGGSWDSFPSDVRSAIRGWHFSAGGLFDLGFRVARTPDS